MTWDQIRADLVRALEATFQDEADTMLTRIERQLPYRADGGCRPDSVTQRAFLCDLATAVGDSFPDRGDRILHKLQRVLERPEDRGNVTVCLGWANPDLEVDGRPRFVVVSRDPPELFATSFVVDRDRMLVGRAPGCDYLVGDNWFSRRHFEVNTEHGRVSIADQRSTNGTFVNGIQIPPLTDVPLASGDMVRAANVIFLFKRDE